MTATNELDETGPADPTPIVEPGDAADEVDDDFLPTRRRRTGPLTITLALLLVAALGVYGGVQLQKHRGKTTTTTTVNFAGRGAGGFPGGAGGFAGAGAGGAAAAGGANAAGGQGGGGGAVFGTVKLVDGNTIYVSATDGSITKVTTTPGSTTITRSVSGTAADLQPGQTVVVQGTAGSDGTVAATRVTEGGLGGGRGGGGGGTGGTGGTGG